MSVSDHEMHNIFCIIIFHFMVLPFPDHNHVLLFYEKQHQMMSITNFRHAPNKTSLIKLRMNAKPGRKLLTLTFNKDRIDCTVCILSELNAQQLEN